jgi:hypothetical protein
MNMNQKLFYSMAAAAFFFFFFFLGLAMGAGPPIPET